MTKLRVPITWPMPKVLRKMPTKYGIMYEWPVRALSYDELNELKLHRKVADVCVFDGVVHVFGIGGAILHMYPRVVYANWLPPGLYDGDIVRVVREAASKQRVPDFFRIEQEARSHAKQSMTKKSRHRGRYRLVSTTTHPTLGRSRWLRAKKQRKTT